MNILLLSMPDFLPFVMQWDIKAPNLGMVSVASNLSSGHNVYVGDLCTRRNKVSEAVRDAVERYKPGLVGLSSMTFQYNTAKKIAWLIKGMNKDIKLALGGYHATLMSPELKTEEDNKLFDFSGEDGQLFDFMVRGEGEATFRELADALDGGTDFDSILGLSYKVNGDWHHNRRRPTLDVKTIKLPDRSKRIWKNYGYLHYVTDTIETSRGCTFTCNFCSMQHMYGTSFRTYEISRVMEDIENCKRAGANILFFVDDNITLNPRRLLEICKTIVREGHNDMYYLAQVSCKGIASVPELSQAMKDAGFLMVFLGIENISKRNLNQLNKGDILEDSRKAIKYLHNAKVLVIGGMILGNPEDTYQDIKDNFDFFRDQEVDVYFDQVLTPYPKTGIREELLKTGLVANPHDFTKYNGFWTNVRTKHLLREELAFLRWKFHRDYFTLAEPTSLYRKVMGPGYYYRLYKILSKKADVWWSTEREVFKKDMEKYRKVNEYL
ncbi:MAG TPA: B12-binding domain-containing radical SAM protein [Candidatus Avalokitesvara rifleensis]|uniref:B12-binding domain-containing radical SAM protein n=1 Tax=Candidatus Avalokitesvara rifleensis TaxID=3367620 RepID=UPI002712AC41|nr:radical SAM protein [Candidatus Brocadiales bacterium]